MLKDSDKFFVPEGKCPKVKLTEIGELSFESPMQTPYEVNNIVYAKYYPSNRKSKKAIILIHHRGGNIGTLDAMAKIFANRGISALTMLMPYHGIRAPEGTKSGEFFTSANIKRTIDAFRQAVLEIHWATDWLATLHSQIGIVGISLGGIVATLACAHDERLKTACICHSGADLAAITFRGLATQKIKEAFLRIGITEEKLRTYWKAIDPVNYIHKMKETQLLQLNTLQDTVFPLSCQKKLSLAFKESNVKYKLSLFPFPCGHYSAGKYLLPKLYLLAKVFLFLRKNL
jgi:dienelactone hydrolase